MNEVKLNLSSGNRIKWPNKCAFCGAKAEALANASCTMATGYYIVAWSQRTNAISYPVCRRHRLLCFFLDRPAKLGTVGSFLALIFIPGILWVAISLLISVLFGLKGDNLTPISNTFGAILFFAMVIFFIYAASRKPIKLIEIKKNVAKLEIFNADFFREFKLLNAEIIE